MLKIVARSQEIEDDGAAPAQKPVYECVDHS
jgi:hypothetical protein